MAAESAYNDLRLCQNILRFREVDEVVTEAALNKMRRHTSYLKPEMVVFCPASEAVNADHRADIASTPLKRPNDLLTEKSADSAASVINPTANRPKGVSKGITCIT